MARSYYSVAFPLVRVAISTTILLGAWLQSASPVRADRPVSFAKDIRPILEAACWKCHGGAAQLSKLDLRTRESALRGGALGPAIEPGNPQASRLYRLVAGVEKPSMPLDGKLSPEQ